MLQISKIVGIISCVSFSLMMALSGCQSTTGKTASQTMSDTSISAAVQKKLTTDRLSNFVRIDVDTERGVVNLSGIVQTEEQRMRMGRLAHEVAGVVKVNQESAGLEFQVPFGGMKESSSGSREQGKAAREFFTQWKTVYLDMPPQA